MKKLSLIIKEEKAFYLPLVLLITTIILSSITTTVILYRNELMLTQQITHQIEAETIFQMSRNQFFTSEVYKEQANGEIIYEYPTGKAILKYTQITDTKYVADFTIITTNQFILETATYLVVE